MLRFINVIICISLVYTAFTQNSVIQGRILDETTGDPVSHTSVYISNSSIGTISDAKGEFKLKDLSGGNYTLIASSIGYETVSKDVFLEKGETINVDFSFVESISNLSEVTVMSGGNSGIRGIPGSVHFLSKKELDKFDYTDISRTLMRVPGVNIQEEDGFGLRPNIGLRGSGVERSSKITVMEDGILMAPAPYAAPAAYYFPTPGRMEAIEILKGSSQIKYGPYTTGGAINLVSTQIPSEFSGKVDIMAGNFGSRSLHAFVGNSHSNVAYSLESFQFSADGFKKLDSGGNTGFNKSDYLAKLQLNSRKDSRIYQSLNLKYGHARESSNETYLGLTDQDFRDDPLRRYAASDRDKMTTRQNQYSASYRVKFSHQFNINATAYKTDFKRNWYKLDKVKNDSGEVVSIAAILEDPQQFNNAYNIIKGESSVNEDALFMKANNRAYKSGGVQLNSFLDLSRGEYKHLLDIGFRYHTDQVDRFQWIDYYEMIDGTMLLTQEGEEGTESNRIDKATAYSAYVSYKFKYDKLTIIPGIRYENIKVERIDYGKSDPERIGNDISERSNSIDVWIPGVGIDYRFSKTVSVFGGIHRGFAPPGSKEGTEAETSINYELGSRVRSNAFSTQLVLFYNDYSNLLGSDLSAAGGSGSGDQFNGGEAMVFGIEWEVEYDVLSNSDADWNLPIYLSYTFTNGIFQNDFSSEFEGWNDVEDGDMLPYLANNQLMLGASIQNFKWNFNMNARYQDRMRTLPGSGEIKREESTDAYILLDISSTYSIIPGLRLFVSITNLTDKVYIVSRRPAGVRPGLPRAYRIGIKASF